MSNDNWQQEASMMIQKVDRRSIIRILGAGAFFAGPGAQLATAHDDLNEMSDEELMDRIGELFKEIDVLFTGSPDLLVAEYRFEALQALYDDVSDHDFNKSNKRTLLRCLESALEDNHQVIRTVLDLDPESASTYHHSIESTLSTFRHSVDVINDEQFNSETAESWRERAATIIDAREDPLSVFELIEEEQAAKEWWEAIDERGERIGIVFQELQDRGYSPTVEEIDGEFGISVNQSWVSIPVGGYATLKGAALVIASAFGSITASPLAIGAVAILALGAGLYLAWPAVEQMLLQLSQHHPVIQRILIGGTVSNQFILEFLVDILEFIDLVEQYDPDVHDPIQFVGAALYTLISPVPTGRTLPTPEGEEEESSITIQLIDAETAEAIPDGTVTLHPNRTGHSWGPETTNEDGIVVFEDLGPFPSFDDDGPERLEVGSLQANAAGYEEAQQSLSWHPSDGPLDLTVELEADERGVERSVLTVNVVGVSAADYPEIPSVTVERNGETVAKERVDSNNQVQFSLEDGHEYTVSADGIQGERTVVVEGDTEITLSDE